MRTLRYTPMKGWHALTDPAALREWAPFDADRNLATTRPATLPTVGAHAAHVTVGNVKRGDAAGWHICFDVMDRHLAAPSEEVPLNWNSWIRQIHRWLSITFTVTVIANFIALAQGTGAPPNWVTYSPLLPLALLLLTGLYMFALPYIAKWRSGSRRST